MPDITATRLATDPAASTPVLTLRSWTAEDAARLVELHRDPALRRWLRTHLDDEADAARWLAEQRRAWEAGTRFAFAVEQPGAPGLEGPLVGHVVLTRRTPDAATAEIGYWTAAHARGLGVAPRSLRALTEWAFRTLAPDGLTRLELRHQVDNTASCRVAEKSGYPLSGLLPAAPPAWPRTGHLHARQAPSASCPELSELSSHE
ncbi:MULTISPECIES: GNAT family N-acetyltransferase [Streptomyces]|uniref:Ribosomal-protein-serine acetyltransferase n=1 Tax=Streptomyces chartreusis NRRL 3882 TaxID=1079985 RepID=A0A2N9B7J2_STRCX|nr:MULTISPECIES: GNAT family N-acetyltransferase [Streptomyces]MYS91757.1 GNAT family N-acetyltransferase [Streptomyces sp. SID5464]SOR79326.1 Ribosomal-protein-serine acetyltransferase [Streptomyces chartreusis NRRL 3882]